MTYNTDTDFLAKKFGKQVAENSSFRSSWTSLLHTYDLTTEQLHSKWEAWDIANNTQDRSGSFTPGSNNADKKPVDTALKSLDNLRDSLQRDTEKKANSLLDGLSNSTTPISSQRKRPFTPKSGGSKLDNVLGGIGLGSLSKSKVTASARKRSLGGSVIAPPTTTTSPFGRNLESRDGNGTPTKITKTGPELETLTSTPFPVNHENAEEDILIGGEELIYKQEKQAVKGTIFSVLNPEIAEVNNSEKNLPKPNVRPNVDLNQFEYRQMRDTLFASAAYFDEKLTEVRELIQSAYGLSEHEFGDPSFVSQSEIVAVGRIITETVANTDVDYSDPSSGVSSLGGPEEKVGPNVFMICESSVSQGRRVEIRISNELSSKTRLLEQYDDGSTNDDQSLDTPHFFPGQVIAVRGRNANGSYFVVSEFFQIPYLPPTATFESTLKKFYPSKSTESVSSTTTTTDSGLKIVTASGPYTSPKNLHYEPLLDFVNVLNSSIKPNAVILLGPFVDTTHEKIIDGDFELRDIYPSYYFDSQSKLNPDRHELLRNKDKVLATGTLDDIFRLCVLPKIRLLVESNPEIQVILVPHVNDVISRSTSFPQAPFINKFKLNTSKARRGGLKTNKSNEKRSVSFADVGGNSSGNKSSQQASNLQSEEQYAKKIGLFGLKNVHCVSNPCTFSINEVTITACSQDSLFDILKNTHAPKPVNSANRLKLALNDMLRQRTVYPLVPGSVYNKMWSAGNKPSESEDPTNEDRNQLSQIQLFSSASLSIPHLDLAHFPDALPDILITPSRLQPMVQVLHNVVVLNPGSVAKMGRSGDYAVVSVNAPSFDKPQNGSSLDDTSEDQLVNHEVYKRARVELVKL